jgi:FtsP/CotA-like multicopper oxidase with cupredoxin domain
MHNYSRRRFLTHSAMGFLAFANAPAVLRAMESMQAMPKMTPNKPSAHFKPDVEFELYCQSKSVPIFPGQATLVQHYSAKLLHGPSTTLTEIPNSYLGPLIRLQKGQKVRIHLINKLAEATITHWHGLHVPANMDGHPVYAINPGERYVYEFEVLNRASMNIYHPHPHETTAKQVYHGLAGALFVHDQEEAALELPSGEFEVPLVIQDRLFDDDNQLIYIRHMHDRMMGFYGDRILVNGQTNFQMDVASRAYRLRILNGSTARIYKLVWDDGMPITVLGVDGGLLEKPETKSYVMLAPGERLDVWADFSGRNPGSQLTLRSIEFSGVLPKMAAHRMQGGGGGGMGMMGGGHGRGMMQSALPVGSAYPILTVRVTQKMSDSPAIPSELSKIKRYKLSDTANPNKPVGIGISEAPMAMLLNGRPYAYNDVQDFEHIKVNTVQLLEIFHAHSGGHGNTSDSGSDTSSANAVAQSAMPDMSSGRHRMMQSLSSSNDAPQMQHSGMGMMGGGHGRGMMSGMNHTNESSQAGGMMMGMGGGMGMMMSMAHPIHLHGQSFQIVSRSVSDDVSDAYATVRDGFIDSGWKDTVLVMPGERVRIIKPFQDFKGLFMYHCHNLEHEDMGMMRDFLVE